MFTFYPTTPKPKRRVIILTRVYVYMFQLTLATEPFLMSEVSIDSEMNKKMEVFVCNFKMNAFH